MPEPAKVPVFVLSYPRSGSTLLAALLDNHPNISCGHETQFFENGGIADLMNQVGSLSWVEAATKSVEGLTLAGSQVRDLYGLSQAEVRSYLLFHPPSITAPLEALAAQRAARTNKRRWAEKSPIHLRHYRLIRASYPDSPIILLSRDLREVTLSLKNLPLSTADDVANAALVSSWTSVRSLTALLEDKRTLHIRYADLARQPSTVMSQVWDFLGEPDVEVLLEERSPQSFSAGGETWKKDVAGEIRERSNWPAWESLPAADRELIQTQVGSFNRLLGYESNERRPRSDQQLRVAVHRQADLLALADLRRSAHDCAPPALIPVKMRLRDRGVRISPGQSHSAKSDMVEWLRLIRDTARRRTSWTLLTHPRQRKYQRLALHLASRLGVVQATDLRSMSEKFDSGPFPRLGSASTSHPTLRAVYKELEASDIKVVPMTIKEAALSAGARPEVYHLNWIDHIANNQSARSSLAQAVKLATLVFIYRARGGIVIWTCHNIRAHESRNPKIERWVQRYLVILAHRVHFLSMFARTNAEVFASQGLLDRKSFTSPMPISDLGIAKRDDDLRSTERGPGITFLICGALRAAKGVENAICDFARANLPPGSRLIVAGRPVSEAYGDALQQAATLSESVDLFLEWQSDSELADLLHSADCVILPYRSSTNSAIAPMALAAGVPLLTTGVGALEELARLAPLQDHSIPLDENGEPRLTAVLQDVAAWLTTADRSELASNCKAAARQFDPVFTASALAEAAGLEFR